MERVGRLTLNKNFLLRSPLEMFLQTIRFLLTGEVLLCCLQRTTRFVSLLALSLQRRNVRHLQTSIRTGTNGAAEVSSNICFSFRSCGAGRCWRCFSREFRLSRGEMDRSSTFGLVWWSGGELLASAIEDDIGELTLGLLIIVSSM